MKELTNHIYKLKVWTNSRGQDLIEYSLATGMVAVACVAAMPVMSNAVNNVFSKIGSIVLNTVK